MRRTLLLFAAGLLLCGILAVSAPDAFAVPRVVTSIAPLHSLASAVMEGVDSPHLLLRGGESPHTFTLRPSDARRLNDADLVFWIGPQLEQPLARILPNLRHAQSVPLLRAPGVQLLPMRGLHGTEDAAHGHAAHDLDQPDADPHIWLSPPNAAAIGHEIARLLGVQDPDNAGRYRANAEQLDQRLRQLDEDLRRQFAGNHGNFVVFHDAYQYLEARYDLQSVGTVTTHAERSPGVAHMQALRALLVERRVLCLFSEPQFQARMVAVLGEGLPVRHAVLDPLGAAITPGPDAYEQLMLTIADRFTDCVQGG